MNVFPPRNLPGRAETWGRAVEDRLRQAERNLSVSGSANTNLALSTAGQLGATEGLVDELLNRRMDVVYAPSMSVTGTTGASVNQDVTLPAAPGARSAFLTVSGVYSTSATGNPTLFVRRGGERLMRLIPVVSPLPASTPNESTGRGQFQGFCRIASPNNTPIVLNVEMFMGGSPSTSTITLSEITLTLERSGV